MGNPIQDPLVDDPPGLLNRTLFVKPAALNTVRIMRDPLDAGFARWFDQDGMPPVLDGNEVAYLIAGSETYPAMIDAIRKTRPDKGHFIYLLAWILRDGFEMVPGDPTTTFQSLLQKASADGVEIRAMLWANVISSLRGVVDKSKAENFAQVKFINSLPTGKAIHDNHTLTPTGVHHQKVMVVNNDDGLVAFCGGLDINNDRVDPPPFHDVHCRIRGPAAAEVLRVFVERWQDNPESAHLPIAGAALVGKNAPAQPVRGRMRVQIGRTYPKGKYAFAPKGEQSARRLIIHAIRSAKRFIYLEDQYLVNMECSEELKKAVPNVDAIVIFIPGDGSVDNELEHLPGAIPKPFGGGGIPLANGQAKFRRMKFISNIQSAPGGVDKVHVFEAAGGSGFVHSKVYIVDDQFAIIGSANCNRRGWEHDSEVMAGIYDPCTDDHYALNFAHRLRMRIWARNLGLLKDPAGFAQVVDGPATVGNWMRRPPGSVAVPYTIDLSATLSGIKGGAALAQLEWDNLVDPGSPLG